MTVTHPSVAKAHRVRSSLRLLAFVVLAVALAAPGMGLLVGCGSDENAEDTEGVASAEVQSLIETWMAAHNKGDVNTLWPLYAEDAAVEDFINGSPPAVTEGRAQVVDMDAYWGKQGLGFQSSGLPLQIGPYVVQAVRFTAGGAPAHEGVFVFFLDEDGKFLHEWVSGYISTD